MKRLKLSELRDLPTSLEGVKLTVAKPIQGDVSYQVGEDVTKKAAAWPNLSVMMRLGFIQADPPVNYMALQQPAPKRKKAA